MPGIKRKLKLLEIDKPKREYLIKSNCNLIGKIIGLKSLLEKGTDSAIRKGLKKEQAFLYLAAGQERFKSFIVETDDRLLDWFHYNLHSPDYEQVQKRILDESKIIKKAIYS